MPSSPLICVTDANIWIDVHNGDLVTKTFLLPFQFVAPDLVIEELESPDANLLMQQGLQMSELDSDDVIELAILAEQYARRQVSMNDLAALVLAKKLGVMLLTNERQLRRIARSHHLQIHGTLWLLDEMIRLQIISRPNAAVGLQKMLNRGARLPKGECEIRLRLWLVIVYFKKKFTNLISPSLLHQPSELPNSFV
jgi:predicted nucleic acid-binding protein